MVGATPGRGTRSDNATTPHGIIEADPEAEEQIVAFRLDMLQANMQRTVEGIRDLVQ
jgi:hypothetical protein